MGLRAVQGTRVLLTGASSGIGAALARRLAAQGARVLVTARRQPALDALASDYPNSISVLAGDLSDSAHRQRLVDWVATEWQGLDLLINNAGVGAMGSFIDATPERMRQLFEVNFFAPAELCRLSYPLLKQGNRPAVVWISSVLGHRAVPFKSEYCASKFAVHGFSDALRAEWSREGIDVTLVSPSTTDSAFFDAALEDTTQRQWKGRRPMSPDQVALCAIRAWRRGKHEAILPFSGKLLVWLDRIAPTLANRIVARWG